MSQLKNRNALSLMELVAVAALLGVLAMVTIRKVQEHHDTARIAACYTNRGHIEIQAELWMHNTGTWPLGNLSNIGADLNYFPEGLPICPVDGSPYQIDPITGLALGHNH